MLEMPHLTCLTHTGGFFRSRRTAAAEGGALEEESRGWLEH